MIPPEIASLRKIYSETPLNEEDASSNPFRQFESWFAEVLKSGISEPNAMTLATCSPGGSPSARIVLLKELDSEGFVFYTNYESRKGREIQSNPQAALVFFWKELERQVRVEGRIIRISEQESDSYFLSRPEGSRFSAWVSHQSTLIPSRESLDLKMKEIQEGNQQAAGRRPPFWGGYRLLPDQFEFWQGRKDRLHDRLWYIPDGLGSWTRQRLAP